MAQKATTEIDAIDLKYSIDKLRENCLQLFGVTVSTFDGATYGMIEEYSVDEIKMAIKEWNEKEVKS